MIVGLVFLLEQPEGLAEFVGYWWWYAKFGWIGKWTSAETVFFCPYGRLVTEALLQRVKIYCTNGAWWILTDSDHDRRDRTSSTIATMSIWVLFWSSLSCRRSVCSRHVFLFEYGWRDEDTLEDDALILAITDVRQEGKNTATEWKSGVVYTAMTDLTR